MASDAEIPRFLLVALAQAQRAFARHDRTAFGTINEYVQPVADAALSWIYDVERERDEARAENARLREALTAHLTPAEPVADTGDCRTCKWADAAVCHNPEGKRKNFPVWTWCGHALAEDLVTRLGTSPPCPGYTKK